MAAAFTAGTADAMQGGLQDGNHQPSQQHADGLSPGRQDVIGLRDAGVSEKVLNCMLSTPSLWAAR